MISAMASHVNEELARLRALYDGTHEPPPTPRIDLNHAPLFAGLARAILDSPAVEIAPGTELRRTFAYVFAAPMVALSPPPNPRSPHPVPWHALEGGGALRQSRSRSPLRKEHAPSACPGWPHCASSLPSSGWSPLSLCACRVCVTSLWSTRSDLASR